jgi:hypothetical protein
MTKKPQSNWVPEILYEEGSIIPFINVPDDERDPSLLFIFVNRQTGEFEPGLRGERVPVLNMQLRQFADLSILAGKLTPAEYDKVRAALGLEPRAEAAKKGRQITRNVATRVSGETGL